MPGAIGAPARATADAVCLTGDDKLAPVLWLYEVDDAIGAITGFACDDADGLAGPMPRNANDAGGTSRPGIRCASENRRHVAAFISKPTKANSTSLPAAITRCMSRFESTPVVVNIGHKGAKN